MSTNVTPQKNPKSNTHNPRKCKIRDTFLTDLVEEADSHTREMSYKKIVSNHTKDIEESKKDEGFHREMR